MATAAPPEDQIVLFHYEQSIYSHRVLWYLHLRGLKYSECIQPPYLPRPDLTEGLGVSYRRIPIAAIGRDIYCDSRLIIETLEKRFPGSSLTPKTAAEKGLQRLLDNYSIDGGVFWRSASLLPVWKTPFLKDPNFIKDRADLTGRQFDTEGLVKGRPESLAHMRITFDLMESTLLADGRKWILGNEDGPSVADIDAVFPLQWLFKDPLMEDSVPKELINASKYPRTFAWIDRFIDTVRAAEKSDPPNAKKLSGNEAIERILSTPAGAFDTQIVENDPLELAVGDPVTVSTMDYGTSHSDDGILLSLTTNEVCILNEKKIRLHFPRWNFRITAQAGEETFAQEQAPAPVTPDLKLIYHPLSPYSRKVYMIAHELKLTQRIRFEKVVVAPVNYKGWSDNNDSVAQSNPLAKIPTLVPDDLGDGIYDSRTIAEYLLSEAKVTPSPMSGSDGQDEKQQRWRLKTLHACADGILDAEVLLVYENQIRAEKGIKFDDWIEGQTEKITRGLDRLETEAERGTLRILKEDEIADPADVAVAAALGFEDILEREWKSSRPKLAEWFKNWEKRASFAATKPDIDWKTGEYADLGFVPDSVGGRKQ